MKIISLFSGAGGLDLGLIQSGHQIVWANDHDADAVATYKKNIGDHIVPGDIAEIASSKIPDADVIVGGFPCQGFSQANLLRKPDDHRNILYLQFLRILTDKQPKYFLAENVRGILSMDNGNAIQRIERDFRKAGYRVEKKLFNLADYGVPQTRWRVIIAGTRLDIPESQDFQFPMPTHQKNRARQDEKDKSGGKKAWISVGEALKGLPEPSDGIPGLPNHICSKYKVTNRNFTGHRSTDPSKPSPTILARGNGKGGVCAIQHPSNQRRMTIRESAIIQTFPRNFQFIGAMNSCYRQVGNAVPVLFAKQLGQQLKKTEQRQGN